MGQRVFFAFFIKYRGRHRKGVAIYKPFKSIYNKNLDFIEQKMYWWKQLRGSNNKNLPIDIIFVMKFFSDDLFRVAPYSLMLVLNQDVLFRWIYSGQLLFSYMYIVKRVSWLKSSLLLRIQNKHTHKY